MISGIQEKDKCIKVLFLFFYPVLVSLILDFKESCKDRLFFLRESFFLKKNQIQILSFDFKQANYKPIDNTGRSAMWCKQATAVSGSGGVSVIRDDI